MYSLDVNLLKERREKEQPQKETEIQGKKSLQLPSLEGNLPLIIGAAVGVAFPALVGVYWYFITTRTDQVRQEITQLEQELAQLQNQQQAVTAKRGELKQAQENLTAFANIFDKIKPLSAILEDVRDRAPDNLQIDSLQQSENEGRTQFNIQGIGESYEAVNYFFLTLQRSPFIAKETVNLQTANQGDYQIELINDLPDYLTELSPKQVINYNISFELNNKSASELLPILREQGATGLVTRINTLKNKGIFQLTGNNEE